MVKKGTWVRIENTLLTPEQRSANIPEETKHVPYIYWVHGILQEDAQIGDTVKIKTRIGRLLSGKLIEENPSFDHNFGSTIKELIDINNEVRCELKD